MLILVVLIQNPKKEGINQLFVEENLNFFGIKKTNNFLDKITWSLFCVIFILILIFNLLLKFRK